jgi:hypothetical protein
MYQLTEDKLREILDEYFAPQPKRQRLTPEEIQMVSEKINKRIDIPFIGEEREGRILAKIVLELDSFLYDNLPNEMYDLIRSTEDGIDDEEANRLIASLTTLANSKINIPYIPEQLEYFVIRLIITWVFKAMRKGFDMRKMEKLINVTDF